MGDYDINFSELMESKMKYHSNKIKILILYHNLVKRQFLMGSLTGAVAS